MKTSDSIKEISVALLKAQKEMEGAKKDSSNSFFKSKYSDFNAVLEACKGPLNNNGITILQPHRVDMFEGSSFMVVETILLHESGEFISGETKVEVAKANDPQALGSAQSYARRYGLQSMVALPSEDDDGESAMSRNSKSPAKSAPSKPAAKSAPKTTGGFGAKPAPKSEAPAEKKPARAGSFGG